MNYPNFLLEADEEELDLDEELDSEDDSEEETEEEDDEESSEDPDEEEGSEDEESSEPDDSKESEDADPEEEEGEVLFDPAAEDSDESADESGEEDQDEGSDEELEFGEDDVPVEDDSEDGAEGDDGVLDGLDDFDVEVENLVDEEEVAPDVEEEDDTLDLGDDISEMDDEEGSPSKKGGSSDFDAWLEDAGTTGEVSDFENFDELPDNDELESDSNADKFGVDKRSVFTNRKDSAPPGEDKKVPVKEDFSGRTLAYNDQTDWLADCRKNGYRISTSGGSAQTKDRIWKAFSKNGVQVAQFSEEESEGWIRDKLDEGRKILVSLGFLREAEEAPPAGSDPKKKTPVANDPTKKKYSFEDEASVPKDAGWLQVEPSKVGAETHDEVADKVKQAGLSVLFATTAYGKAKVAYPGATPPEKVQAAKVKLGIADAEDPGQEGASQGDQNTQSQGGQNQGSDETESSQDPLAQVPELMKAKLKEPIGKAVKGGSAKPGGEAPGGAQTPGQPQRQDHPEDHPDENTLHIAVKGTDDVLAALQKAGINVKSYGNHGDNDYIRVDSADQQKVNDWMLQHGWDENEAAEAISGAKEQASLGPIKNAMKEVLGDEAPEIENVEGFKEWLKGGASSGGTPEQLSDMSASDKRKHISRRIPFSDFKNVDDAILAARANAFRLIKHADGYEFSGHPADVNRYFGKEKKPKKSSVPSDVKEFSDIDEMADSVDNHLKELGYNPDKAITDNDADYDKYDSIPDEKWEETGKVFKIPGENGGSGITNIIFKHPKTGLIKSVLRGTGQSDIINYYKAPKSKSDPATKNAGTKKPKKKSYFSKDNDEWVQHQAKMAEVQAERDKELNREKPQEEFDADIKALRDMDRSTFLQNAWKAYGKYRNDPERKAILDQIQIEKG